jgi:hypothetical protein
VVRVVEGFSNSRVLPVLCFRFECQSLVPSRSLVSERHLACVANLPEAGIPVALFPARLAAGGNIPNTGFNAHAQYAVAPDGRFLVNMASDNAVTAPITIVHNWAAALKKWQLISER